MHNWRSIWWENKRPMSTKSIEMELRKAIVCLLFVYLALKVNTFIFITFKIILGLLFLKSLS